MAATAAKAGPFIQFGRLGRTGPFNAKAHSVADFLEVAGLQRPNPLLYRCFPLTCARSQE
jgi:hypothetical protein